MHDKIIYHLKIYLELRCHSVTPIRPCDNLSTPFTWYNWPMGADIDHFENCWSRSRLLKLWVVTPFGVVKC